jgi:transposase
VRECPEIATARELTDRFSMLVQERDRDALDPWLCDARTSGISEFREPARGIDRDLAAVQAALSQEWSNGQTEGQIIA